MSFYTERRRIYLPLTGGVEPPLTAFANGCEVVQLPESERPNLQTWSQVLSGNDIRRFHETERWLVYDYESALGGRPSGPEERLATTFIALQVVAPTGCEHFVMFTNTLDSQYSNLTLHTRNRLNACGWARLLGWDEAASDQVCRVVDGIWQATVDKQVRFLNPMRLFEQGLYARDPYMQTLLWVMGLDGLLMATKKELFVNRLCSLIGATTPVFPALKHAALVCRSYSVKDLAGEMYELRSVIAHGRPVPEKFWKPLPDIEVTRFEELPYRGMVALREVVAEGAVLLLSGALRKIILDGLMPLFSRPAEWRRYLDS